MTEQQTPDREKKIAEIKQALEKATPGPWHMSKLSAGYLVDDKGKDITVFIEYNEDGSVHMEFENWQNNARLIANAPEWLRFLLDELEGLEQERNMYKSSSEVFYERLKKVWEEREKAFNLLQKIEDEILYFGELVKINLMSTSLEEKAAIFNRKIETLKAEREKLINELQVYANPRNWAGDVFCPPEGVSEHYDDGGQRARDILREIGVTVEPDRLHDARAKIAKARFSPERLLKEHQWRPIETAPRDGTTILVYDDGDVYQARWNEKHKYWEYANHEQFGCGCCSAEIDGATHWMPIPALPRGVRG